MKRLRLISSDEATPVEGELKAPCSDCPWARTALNGWLGSLTSKEWLEVAVSEAKVPCHAHRGPQCAGLAIFRTHICKRPRDPEAQLLPANRERVFASPAEFQEHHAKPLKGKNP